MDDNERFSALERRLERIEAAIGLSPLSKDKPTRSDPESPLPATPIDTTSTLFDEPTIAVVPIDYPSTTPTPLPANPVRQGTLEETIGLKWAGWVGAIVFVIGAGLLISWLKANGYFAAIPPAARVAAMALVGFVLIGAGEWVFRKFDPYAAAGLFGGGVAVLLLVGYAGHGFYNLYGQGGAYVAMGAATVIGAFVAARSEMVSVGVLAILGGAIAPALLAEGPPRPVGFFVYLATLQAVALSLCLRRKGGKWWALRITSLIAGVVWVGLTMHVPEFEQSSATSIFCVLGAAFYEAEVLAGVRRGAIGGAGAVFNVGVTGLLTALLLGVSADAGVFTQVMWVISLAGVTAVAGVACRRFAAVGSQAVGFLVQSAALVAVIAPVALSGQWVSIAWMCWAVALAVAGQWFDSPSTRVVPLLVWMLAVIDFFIWSHGGLIGQSDSVAFMLAGDPVYVSAIVGTFIGAGGLLLAALTELIDALDGALPIAAAAVWVMAVVAGMSAALSTMAVAALAWLFAAVAAVSVSKRLLATGGAVLAVASIKWIVVDVLINRSSGAPGATASTALLSVSAVESLVLAASVAGIYLWQRRKVDDYMGTRSAQSTAVAVIAIIAIIISIGATVEVCRWVDRVIPRGGGGMGASQWTQLLCTGVWTLGVIGFAAAAQRLDRESTKCAAHHLFESGKAAILLAAKFVLLDTARYRLWGPPGPGLLLANPRFAVAAVLIAFGVLFDWRASHLKKDVEPRTRDVGLIATLVVAVWAGTLEIDQTVSRWMTTIDGGHVVLSVFWAMTAVGAVVGGFWSHRKAARYFGLTLLAVTLTKVFVIDLSHVQTGLRILSFMALGGLLLITSVLYGKISPARRERN